MIPTRNQANVLFFFCYLKLFVQSVNIKQIDTLGNYIKIVDYTGDDIIITYSKDSCLYIKKYDKYEIIQLENKLCTVNYTSNSKVSVMAMAPYTSSSQYLLVNKKDANIFSLDSILKDISFNYESVALLQTAAFLNDYFYIGTVYDNKAYIYQYDYSGTFINSTSFSVSENSISCIGVKDQKIICLFAKNDNNIKKEYYRVVSTDLSLTDKKKLDPSDWRNSQGEELIHVDYENNLILYCIFKIENSGGHFYYCNVGEYSSNQLTNVSPIDGEKNFAVVYPCEHFQYTAIKLLEIDSFIGICKKKSSTSTFMMSIVKFKTNDTMKFDINLKEIEVGSTISYMSIGLFHNRKNIAIFLIKDNNVNYFTLFQPSCQNFTVENFISLSFKYSLDFTKYVSKNNFDDFNGDLTILFEDDNSYPHTIKIFKQGESQELNDYTSTFSLSELVYSAEQEGTSQYYYRVQNTRGVISEKCKLIITIHNCYEGCSECYGVGTADDMNCRTCDNGKGYYKISGDTSSNCYKSPSGYYLDDTVYKRCYESCSSCSGAGTNLNNNCTDCGVNYYPSSDDSTQCWNSTTKPDNFYYSDERIDKIEYKKCHVSCLSCLGAGSDSYTNCSKCDNENGYYALFSNVSKCLNTTPSQHYLEPITKTYEKCYHSCENCDGPSTVLDHNCTSCLSGFIQQPLKEKNCVTQCQTGTYWYIDDNNVYQCTSGYWCPKERAILEKNNNQCIESCKPSGTCLYCRTHEVYEYNNQCIDKCPVNTRASYADRYCFDDDNCRYENYKSNITLSELSSNIDLIGYNYSLQYAHTDKQVVVINSPNDDYKTIIFELEECTFQIQEDLTKLDLANCPAILREKYLIPDNEQLIILKTDIYRIGENTNQIAYAFFSKNGTRLSLGYCSNEQFEVKYPITDPEAVDYELAYNMSLIGVDIYNASDPFFTDICFPFTSEEGEDVSLEDRKDRYYKNVSFCEEDCEYEGIDYLTQEAICQCNVKENFITEILNNSLTSDILEVIESARIEVFRCYKNVFYKKGFLRNLGGWIFIGFIIIEIILLIVYLYKRLVDIKIYLHQFIQQPNNPPGHQKPNNYIHNQPPKFVIEDLEDEKNKENFDIDELNSPALLINPKKRIKPAGGPDLISLNDMKLSQREEKKNSQQNETKITPSQKNNIAESQKEKEIKNINLVQLPSKLPNYRRKQEYHTKTNNNPLIPEQFQNEINNRVIVKNLIEESPVPILSNQITRKKSLISNQSLRTTSLDFTRDLDSNSDIQIFKKTQNYPPKKYSKKGKIQKYTHHEKDFSSLSKASTEKLRINASEKPKEQNNKEEEDDLNDDELNELCVQDARKYDNRHFCQFYWSLLKQRQDIINTFFNSDPLDCFPIKCICFIFGIAFYFFVNGLFFIPSYLSDLLHGKEKFNFFSLMQNEISRFIYSAIVSLVVDLFENFLSNSKKRLEVLIKKKKYKSQFYEESYEILKTLQTRHIIFLVTSFLLMFVFWYYTSAFCDVYYNSRINWLEGSIITYLLGNISPLISSILITSFRYIGMRFKYLSFFYLLSQIINSI